MDKRPPLAAFSLKDFYEKKAPLQCGVGQDETESTNSRGRSGEQTA